MDQDLKKAKVEKKERLLPRGYWAIGPLDIARELVKQEYGCAPITYSCPGCLEKKDHRGDVFCTKCKDHCPICKKPIENCALCEECYSDFSKWNEKNEKPKWPDTYIREKKNFPPLEKDQLLDSDSETDSSSYSDSTSETESDSTSETERESENEE